MAYWGDDPFWQSLSPTQKAAAMALLEAGSGDYDGAKNAMGAMINRAGKEGVDLGKHVSGKIYQPTIEPTQYQRLPKVLQDPKFNELVALADSRMKGETKDWVGGATHFLAKPETMLALEAKEPNKYKNWGPRGANWTGYDPKTGQYANTVMADNSHVFLAPEGRATGESPPNATAPSTAPTDQKDSPDMLNFLAALGGSGNLMAGLGKGLGLGGMEAAGGQNSVFGSLASMFGGGGMGPDASSPAGGAMGASGLQGPSGGGQGGGENANMQLAQSGANAAAGLTSGGQQQMQLKKPMDLAMLAKILQQRTALGAGANKGLGVG